MDSLVLLEENLRILLQQQQELQEQLRLLKEENIRKQDDLEKTYSDLHKLKKEYQHLQTAHALLSGDELAEEDRQKAKQRLTSIISQIDRALDILKQ